MWLAALGAACQITMRVGPFRFGKLPTPPPPSPAPLAALVESSFDPIYLPYVLCAIVALLGSVWWACQPKRRRLPGFPEVSGRLPIIGHGHLVKPERVTERFEAWLNEFGGEDGVCECTLGDTRYVIVGGHAAMMELMRQRPFKVQRSDTLRTMDGTVTLFHAEGDEWRVHRRFFSPAFGQAHMEAYLPAVKTIADRLVHFWRSGPGFDLGSGEAAAQPINQPLTELTADTTSLIAFNFDLDSLRKKTEIAEDVHTVFEMGLQRVLMYGVFRYWTYPFGTYLDGMGQALRRTTATLTGAVTQHKLANGSGRQGKGVGTFLDNMLARVALGEGRDGGKDVFTERRMADNLLVAFLAGTDTTSNALMRMLYALAKDPELQEECATEALSFDLSAADEATAMSRLPAIRSLYWEINRLHGAAGFLIFEPSEGHEVTLMGRTLLPKSQGGSIAIFAMLKWCNRTKEAAARAGITDPEVFDPRRWIGADGTVRQPPIDGYLSFGHGPRVCPGRGLSHLVATVTVATVLRAFALTLPEDHPPVGMITHGTDRPDKEIKLLFTPRMRPARNRTAP